MIYPRYTFTSAQQRYFRQFDTFKEQTPSAFCAYCLQLLYPDQVFYEAFAGEENDLPCYEWGFLPTRPLSSPNCVVVCKQRHDRHNCIEPIYCGPTIPFDLNYHERGAVAPLKLMNKMTRMKSANRAYCGQYQVSGALWTERNLDFSDMLYGGTLGMPYNKDYQERIDPDRVQTVFGHLCTLNPRLNIYTGVEMQALYARFTLAKVAKRGDPLPVNSWPMNYLMHISDVTPNTSQAPLDDLVIGSVREYDVKFSEHPDLLVLLFPYLYTNGRGYYSLCSPPPAEDRERSENEGGYAVANMQCTLTKYAKQRLLLADRRFGRSPEYLFFMMDMIEKHNIHSSNRHVVPLKEREAPLRRQDVFLDGAYKFDRVSLVPYVVRSSYAYKRIHSLNLQAMFDALGLPQLFITLTCNGFATEFMILLEGERPWMDPVLFALHYKRMSQEIMNKYIKKGVKKKRGCLCVFHE